MRPASDKGRDASAIGRSMACRRDGTSRRSLGGMLLGLQSHPQRSAVVHRRFTSERSNEYSGGREARGRTRGACGPA